VFCYSNADIRKGEDADEIFRFIDFWKRQHGKPPQHLVFDSKLTTYVGLDRLDVAGITFITLRRRSPALLAKIASLPASAWRTVELDVPHRKYRNPRVYEQKARPLQRSYRQFFIADLGHDEPTILLTNDAHATAKSLVTRYAKRMLIENALADAVRFFISMRCPLPSASRSTSIWLFSSLLQAFTASWPVACVVTMTRKRAKSSAISSTCRPTSPLQTTKLRCASIAEPISPSCSPQDFSINRSKCPGGTAAPCASSSNPRHPIVRPILFRGNPG
jgi:hypothetical protein